MEARMKNPVYVVPGALQALQGFSATFKDRLPADTVDLVNLRASQINGCSVCVEMHAVSLKDQGLPGEKIYAVGAWRESPYFTDAERAALALTESLTRISDRSDAVSDEVWSEAEEFYEPSQLAALILTIATINTWNRLNVATRQVAGAWTAIAVRGSATAITRRETAVPVATSARGERT
jgi:AhpD family alkylhydroperoxidase